MMHGKLVSGTSYEQSDQEQGKFFGGGEGSSFREDHRKKKMKINKYVNA